MLSLLSLLPLLPLVLSQGLFEPPDGRVLLSAYLDTSVAGNDNPVAFNQRMNIMASAFQMQQTIPLTKYDAATGEGGSINATRIEETGTDAAIVLTVVPFSVFTFITDADYTALGQQIARYMAAPYNRQVFLIFAPEMNANTPYGLAPNAFKATWVQMHTLVKKEAPGVAIVWAPRSSEGYPYRLTLGHVQDDLDRQALDTNRNNQLDPADDPFEPYWPGDQYVDWAGLSYFYKGMQSPYERNQLPPQGVFEGALNGQAKTTPNGLALTFNNFYQNYCLNHNKPCMISDTGCAYHADPKITGVAGSPTQLAMQQRWWQDGITNANFLNTYPKLKMINLFEYSQNEDDEKPRIKPGDEDKKDLRDYRITIADDVRAAFQADLAPVGNYQYANQRAIVSDFSGTNPGGQGIDANATGAARTSSYVFPKQTTQPNVFTGSASRTGMQVAVTVVALWVAVALLA